MQFCTGARWHGRKGLATSHGRAERSAAAGCRRLPCLCGWLSCAALMATLAATSARYICKCTPRHTHGYKYEQQARGGDAHQLAS